MTEQDSTPTSRELLDSVDPLTLEVPILLTVDEWTTVLACVDYMVLSSTDEGIQSKSLDATLDIQHQLFDKLRRMRDALLETGKMNQYHITLIERP